MTVNPKSASALIRAAIGDLTMIELRELLLVLAGRSPKAGRAKQELVDEILTSASRVEVEKAASRIESLAPFKHSWLFSIGKPPLKPYSVNDLREWAARLWPGLFRSLADLNGESNDLQPCLQLVDENRKCVYVKFTQWIQAERWERISQTRKELHVERLRHPVVIALKASLGIGEVRFNGFVQGLATPAGLRVGYDHIANSAAQMVAQRLKTPLNGLRLEQTIPELLRRMPDEVSDVRRALRREGRGRLVVDANEPDSKLTAADLLAEFLGPAARKLSQDDILDALNRSSADSIVLTWKTPQILTRISFRDLAPEILFVWRGGEKSVAAIDFVVQSLVSEHRFMEESSPAEALRFVAGLQPTLTVRVTELVRRFQLSVDDAYGILEEARKRGLVETKYRIRSDRLLQDFENRWRESLSEFPKAVTDEDGEVIELDNPENIEVGFARTGRS